MPDFKQIAFQWLAAFNSHNIEHLLQLYHEDAAHYSPKLKINQPDSNGLIKGKEALFKWWNDAFLRLPHLHYEPLNIMSDQDRIFLEYIRQTPGEPDLQVGEVLIIKDGKIIESRVYHS